MANKYKLLNENLVDLIKQDNKSIEDFVELIFQQDEPNYDEKEELELLKSKFISFLNSKGDFIPDYNDLARLSKLLKLDIYSALLLSLKSLFENNYYNNHQETLSQIRDFENLEQQIFGFKNDALDTSNVDKLFEQLMKVKYINMIHRFSATNIASLIYQAISQRVFFGDCASAESKKFIQQAQQIEDQLLDVNNKEAGNYIESLNNWINRKNEAEDYHLKCEKQRIGNSKVEQEWMKIFGESYIPLVEQKNAVEKLQRYINCKKNNPAYSFDEIESEEKEFLEKQKQELEKLNAENFCAQHFNIESSVKITDQEMQERLDKSKKLLREIYKKTAPDITSLYNFTSEQKEKLTSLYRDAVELRPNEKGYDIRNNEEELKSILNQVDAIWESMGLDIREGYVIQGSNLSEMIKWLNNQIPIIESEIKSLSSILWSLTENKDIKEKKICISDEDIIHAVKDNMNDQLNKYYKQLKELEKEWKIMF